MENEALSTMSDAVRSGHIELTRDTVVVRCHINACISALRDEDGKTKSRELALAVTKLQEASMWIDEHHRVS